MTDDDAKYLYIWAGHANHRIADFLAVIDFDEASPGYGRVINTVRLPARGGTFNEPHHMHLSADGKILGCGGLLSVLSDQPGIFFFDTSDPRKPRFLFSTSDKVSSITDDFFPMPQGGFLITQMGSANGNAPGRVVEFDGKLRRVGSWPPSPPLDGFNPHGISVRPELNLMMTSDFILPASTLNVVPGPPVLRNTIRVWDFKQRTILKTIQAPEAVGTMDVKLIPGDLRGRAYTAGHVQRAHLPGRPDQWLRDAGVRYLLAGGNAADPPDHARRLPLADRIVPVRSDHHARHDQSLQAQPGQLRSIWAKGLGPTTSC